MHSASASRRRVAKQAERYVCRHCKAAFTREDFDAFRRHLADDHADDRFACKVCGKLFKLRGSLLVHERVVHSPAPPVVSLSNKSKYRKEIMAGSGATTEATPTCNVCGKRFETQAKLILHSVEHIKEQRMLGPAAPPSDLSVIREPVGAEATAAASGPSNHKQWECQVCKKTFTTKYFLKKHNRLHTGANTITIRFAFLS